MTYDRIHEWWRAVRKARFIADSKAVCSGYLGRLGRGDKSDLVQCFCNWIISDIDRVTLNGTKHLLLVLLSLPVRDSSDSSLCGCSLCVHMGVSTCVIRCTRTGEPEGDVAFLHQSRPYRLTMPLTDPGAPLRSSVLQEVQQWSHPLSPSPSLWHWGDNAPFYNAEILNRLRISNSRPA